jgi:hypothetical protein
MCQSNCFTGTFRPIFEVFFRLKKRRDIQSRRLILLLFCWWLCGLWDRFFLQDMPAKKFTNKYSRNASYYAAKKIGNQSMSGYVEAILRYREGVSIVFIV